MLSGNSHTRCFPRAGGLWEALGPAPGTEDARAALPGKGSLPGSEGRGSVFVLIGFSYIPCAFDLKKACTLLMWARSNIVGNGSLKFLSSPVETAG